MNKPLNMQIPRKRKYRLRSSPMRRCYRAWLRHEGHIIRLVCFNDYYHCTEKQLLEGGRSFVKRISHKRWPKGFHLFGCEWSAELTGFYAALPADEWIEIVSGPARERECIKCKCTDSCACIVNGVPCHWVSLNPPICSAHE